MERKGIKMILNRIESIFNRCGTDFPVMPPTQLYNEGWMLRLILDRYATIGIEDKHPLAFSQGCKWYSEALLPSAFLTEGQRDSRAESWTHADGVIGHFNIGKNAKGDLTLNSGAKHFVVLEAKMSSKLSGGVRNAPYFNQAARYVACIAEILKRDGVRPHEFTSLGFFVLAPENRINKGSFKEHLDKESLRKVVGLRVKEYGGDRDAWFSEWFRPVLERLDINTVSWEELVKGISQIDETYGKSIHEFYEKCKSHNGIK